MPKQRYTGLVYRKVLFPKASPAAPPFINGCVCWIVGSAYKAVAKTLCLVAG